MMSAKIGLLKTNIVKNRSARLFCKTMSSRIFHNSRSHRIFSKFTATKSTKYDSSKNNITNTIQSSLLSLSKNIENPISIELGNFHKQFILNKNNNMKINYLTNFNNSNKKVINLKKSPLSQTIYSSFSDSLTGKIPIIKDNSSEIQKNDKEKNKVYSFNSEYNKKETNIFNNCTINNGSNTHKSLINNKLKYKLFNLKNFKNRNKMNLGEALNLFKTENIINNKEHSNSNLTFAEQKDKNKNNKNKTNISFNKTEEKIKIYYNRNNPRLIDRFAYPNIHHTIRIEPPQEFFYKTKLIIFYNYRKYLNNNAYLKHQVKKNFEVDKELFQERNLKLFEKLFNIYKVELLNYIQFLNKKVSEMQEENESLIRDKYELIEEISRIKINIMKGMAKIREGFSIKYFMTCVKNHTLTEKNFSPEDLYAIREERKKLKESYYNPRKQKKRRSFKKQSMTAKLFLNNNQVRKNQEQSLTKKFKRKQIIKIGTVVEKFNKNFFRKVTKDLESISIKKRFEVLNSVGEFFEHLDLISSNVYNLIVESNNKNRRNVYLKIELANVIKNTTDAVNHSNYLQGQINIYENRLKNLKAKYNVLLSNYNKLKTHQFQRNVKFLLVIRYIHKIYNNIKKENKIVDLNKEIILPSNESFYMEIVENFFFKILNKVNNIKKIKPKEYEVFKAKLDKRKKKIAFFNYQKLLAEKIQIKVDKVLQKAEKIIYKPYKKTNDYLKDYKKHKTIKSEIKKSNLELFEEYLDDDSF